MKNCSKIASILLLIIFCNVSTILADGDLKFGFYGKTCPSAEAIVRKVVQKAVHWNPGLGAGLIRMHFHDCFVRGCDASVLIDSTKGNPSEKADRVNGGLRGFEVIDAAKSEIEAACPKTVSCADIIAFAARDGSLLLGGIDYAVPSGRRDGRISKMSDPKPNLPPPFFDVAQLKDLFARKGLSLDEMVILSGAHSTGIAPCRTFSNRLSNFNATLEQDPSIAPEFAKYLRTICFMRSPTTAGANNQSADPTVPLDFVTPNKLDNAYYKNLIRNVGVLTSDQTLTSSHSTAKLVWKYAKNGKLWAKKYAAAMVRMGEIEVLTGKQGEIRRNCRVVN